MYPNILQTVERKLQQEFPNATCIPDLLEHASEALRAEELNYVRHVVVNVGERYLDDAGKKYGSQLIEQGFLVPDNHFQTKGHRLPNEHIRKTLLVILLFTPRHVVRIRLDEEGKLKREVFLYIRDIVQVMCVRNRVLRVQHRGGEFSFQILLPSYRVAVQLHEFIDRKRHALLTQRQRA
ncbi:MAG: hypothetical protein QY325_13680 [Flavobacteriales bacterium]|nr:MAG: hypothetical protein QY325_13680 [Flavobacteriales bacterium]